MEGGESEKTERGIQRYGDQVERHPTLNQRNEVSNRRGNKLIRISIQQDHVNLKKRNDLGKILEEKQTQVIVGKSN